MTNNREAVEVVRLNARIHCQREEIKHKQFVIEQIESRANRLLDLLGIGAAQPLVERLSSATEALSRTPPTATEDEVERVARAIEVARCTIERDIPIDQRGQVVADSKALARAAISAMRAPAE